MRFVILFGAWVWFGCEYGLVTVTNVASSTAWLCVGLLSLIWDVVELLERKK